MKSGRLVEPCIARTILCCCGFVAALCTGACATELKHPSAPRSTGPSASAASWFAAPWGSKGADGSFVNPWDLATALAGGNGIQTVIVPGDTIWLRGGNYAGSFTSKLAGTATAPIIVRQYPLERATILGNLTVQGQDVWFWGFEVLSPTPTGPQVNGINSRAPRAKYINMVVHDAAGTGIGLFDQATGVPAPDCEVYGSLLYNNGQLNNNDHGVYTYNHQGTKVLRDNIVFGNWAVGLHAYATAPSQYLEGIQMIGNVSFNNGTISSSGGYDILIGGSGVAAHGAVLRDNYTYRNDSKLSVDAGWYFSSSNGDLTAIDNYIVGTFEIDDWTSTTVTGNSVYSTTNTVTYSAGLLATRGNIAGHTWSGNTFIGTPGALQWAHHPAGPGTFTPIAYNSWLTSSALTNPGAFVAGPPTGVNIVVRPNQYEPGRANIIVYNWVQQPTVSVDVSGVLKSGDKFVVRNAQDFYRTPVLTGTYTGAPLVLPTAGIQAVAPIGRGHSAPMTGPTFNVFVLMTTP